MQFTRKFAAWTAVAALGAAGVLAAETSQARQQWHGHARFGQFMSELNLTDAQKAQIKAIRQKYQPQSEALRAQAKPFTDAARAAKQKGDTAAARSNMEKAHQLMQGASFRAQENSEIRAILTPDQQAKWDARQKNMAEAGKGGHKGWGKKGNTAPATK